jgi:DNA-binding MarR family transcriptional regulator
VPGNEQVISRIMDAQLVLQRLFTEDRSNPLFSSHLTMPQLRILLLIGADGASGRDLATATGVSLGTMTGMVDRLVAGGLAARREDPKDRRVRRVELTDAGRHLVDTIVTAGAERQRRLLARLDDGELSVVEQAVRLMVAAATAEIAECGSLPPCLPKPDIGRPGPMLDAG